MIEQTPLVITDWHYHPPVNNDVTAPILSQTTLDIMKKRTAEKKGIACRFTASFVKGKESILIYVAEDSYVIDLADYIDKNELLTLLRNSFTKFKEKFELRKLDTVLHSTALSPLDERRIDLDAILPLLV